MLAYLFEESVYGIASSLGSDFLVTIFRIRAYGSDTMGSGDVWCGDRNEFPLIVMTFDSGNCSWEGHYCQGGGVEFTSSLYAQSMDS